MNKLLFKNFVLALSFFIAGGVTHQILTKKDSPKDPASPDNQFLILDRSLVDTFNNYLEDYCLSLARYNSRNELKMSNQMKFLCSHLPVIEYNIAIGKGNQKIISEIIDTLNIFLPSIEKEYLSDKFRSMLSSFTEENEDDKMTVCNLHILENMLMNLYLSHVYRNSISLCHAEFLNNATKDTIRLGETYISKLTFSMMDISGNNNMVKLLNDSTVQPITLKGDSFVETPTSKGNYHHDLLLFVPGFFGERGWHTSVDYVVE